MKVKLFSVYDSKTKLFDAPDIAINAMDFARKIGILVNDANTRYNRHAVDLTAYIIADFDTETGKIEGYVEAERMFGLSELITPVDVNSGSYILAEIKKLLSGSRG